MKKKKVKKINFFLKIGKFDRNENLHPLRCQLSKSFWEIFFGSEVMSNSLEVIFALLFFALFCP